MLLRNMFLGGFQRDAVGFDGAEQGIKQAGEAGVEVFAAQGEQIGAAIRTLPDHAAVPQYAPVVSQR
ncbi:hypothetical protein D3C80_2036010 [compost metagenome]